jgi:hypothetical protein
VRDLQRKLLEARHDLHRIRAHNKVLVLESRENNHLVPSLSSFIFDREPPPVFPAEGRMPGSRDPFGFTEVAFGAGVNHKDEDDHEIFFGDDN